MSIDTETIRNIQKFLQNPVKNYFRYGLSKRMLRLPFLPSKSKGRLQRSSKKRDPRSFITYLETLRGIDVPAYKNFPNFQNSVVDRRSKTLHQDWHISLVKVLCGIYPVTLPTITLSLVTYNSEPWLEGFLESLLNQEFPLDHIDLRITDHGSNDATRAILQDFIAAHGAAFRTARLHVRENLGFGSGHDFNIADSDAPFTLVSNVDLIFAPTSILDAVSIAVGDDPDIACWELRQCPYEHPKYYDPVTLEASWCSHSCILLRTDHYRDVAGYDPEIFMYGEDVELSYRFRGAGYRLRYIPQVPVTHFVDFERETRRIHQLSGSLAAKVLLHYRYMDEETGDLAAEQLKTAAKEEADPERQDAFQNALAQVRNKQKHFAQTRIPKHRVPLLFDGSDYDLRRDGFDLALDSMETMGTSPKVSIITRTHGRNIDVLQEAICSVLNQTYRNIEHVIVEDRTEFAEPMVTEVAEAYGADIRYVQSVAGGRSAAGNEGLKAATGDLLMFLDNDDFLFADHVEVLVRKLVASPELVAAYSLAWEVPVFFSASGRYREGLPHTHSTQRKPYLRETLDKYNFIPIQAILFRRELYDRLGGFDTEREYLEDWELWKRYAGEGPFELVEKTTSVYKTPGDPYFRRERESIHMDSVG